MKNIDNMLLKGRQCILWY